MATTEVPLSAELVRSNHWTAFQPVLWMGALLLGSGTFHLAWMALTGADWNGPLSLRKPGLFGVSAGLTVWSVAWVMTKLHPHRLDRWLACGLAGGLLLEVGLITVQQWRGVPSHFNRTTTFDAAVEVVMLGLILLVTAGIVWLTLRSCWLPALDPATAIALRGGMWLLTLSCGLGIMITMLGERNLAAGKLPEIWGPAGVLKFPHGAALHAIQTLPILAWLLHQLRVSKSAWLIQAALWSQVLFLVHSLWQTMHGRARFDLDWVGGAIFLFAALLVGAPLAVMVQALISFARAVRWRDPSRNSTTN
jgi:hypothetical protein